MIIVVRSPDTDVFVLLLSYCQFIPQTLIFETGSGNNRRLIDIKKIAESIGYDIAKVMPAFHAFTGCDTTSAFVRKGKKGPLSIIMKNKQFVSTFETLGETPNAVPEKLNVELERFVCKMYNKGSFISTNKLRSDVFQSRYEAIKRQTTLSLQSGIDLSLLPPCLSTLRLHILRVNYQAFIWKNAHVSFPELPSPIGCGWKLNERNRLAVDWTAGNVLPLDLIDIMASEEVNESSSDGETAEETVEEDDEIDNVLDIVFEEEEEFC